MSIKSMSSGNRSISMLAGQTPEHHVLIGDVTVGAGGTASITFSNIDQSYQHLQIRGIARSSVSAESDAFRIRLNGDAGNNYARHILYGNGASVYSMAASSANLGTASGAVTGSTATANTFGVFILDILDYSSTAKNKTLRSIYGFDYNSTVSEIGLTSSLWMNSSTAVTSMNLFTGSSSNIVQFSTIQLYGVK